MPKLPFCCLLALVLGISAQAEISDWGNVGQVRPGATIQVVEQSLKSTSGKFVRCSADDLTLEAQGEAVVILREQVYRVSMLGTNRKRNVLVGTAIGATAGLGVGLAIMERESGYGAAVAGSSVGLAGLGAGVGLIMPASKEIYRAKGKFHP